MKLTILIQLVLAECLGVLAAVHTVTVGANNALTFTPMSVTAAPGDTVAFNFVSQVSNVISTIQTLPGK
jgi:plastocyanin